MADDYMQWRGRMVRPDDIDQPVHDGDTLWLETDQGDWYRKVRDIRLKDVFAPELKQPGGPECRRFLADWLFRWDRWPWPFIVRTYRTSTGRDLLTFNRYVSVVYSRDLASCLNTEIQAFVTDNGYPGGTGS